MAQTIIIDTSAYSHFGRGDIRMREFINVHNIILVPLMVIGELRGGFAYGEQQAKNEQLLRKFLDLPNVEIVFPTLATTKHFSELYAQSCKRGLTMGSNDLWIAAMSREHQVPLLTTDQDFCRISGIKLV